MKIEIFIKNNKLYTKLSTVVDNFVNKISYQQPCINNIRTYKGIQEVIHKK